MILRIFKDFFGIRTQVKLSDQIILGIIPIFLILVLWFLTTTGRNTTMQLPHGTFEGYEKTVVAEGTKFNDSIRFTVEDCSIDYVEKEDLAYLVKGTERFPTNNIPARTLGKGVRLTLPAGKLISRIQPKIEPLLPLPQQTEVTPVEPQQPADILHDSESVPESSTSETVTLPQTDTLPVTPVDASLPIPQNTVNDLSMRIVYRFESVETRLFSPVILPSPGEVFRSLPSLWSERALPLNILNSFVRVGAGFLVAFIIVFPLALLMGTFSKFRALFSPLVLFGGYLPIPALVPLTMSVFGTSEQQKVMFLALGFSIYLLPLFVKALEEVDNVYLQTGYTLGAKKYQVLNHILLPIAMPGIFDSMRLGFGIGWGYIILAEMVDMGSRGVGALILTSQRRGPREDIYLVLIAIVVVAFVTDKIWDVVGKKLFPYRSQER